MKEGGRKKETIERAISQLKYIETRNLFAYGKELLVQKHLSFLLPDNVESLSKYCIEWDEFVNPSVMTIAYVHLTKTLLFLKAYSKCAHTK